MAQIFIWAFLILSKIYLRKNYGNIQMQLKFTLPLPIETQSILLLVVLPLQFTETVMDVVACVFEHVTIVLVFAGAPVQASVDQLVVPGSEPLAVHAPIALNPGFCPAAPPYDRLSILIFPVPVGVISILPVPVVEILTPPLLP